MKIFCKLLIIFLTLQTISKANDIRDFKIEGISVGDSLLDFISKDEIIKSTNNVNFKDDTYSHVYLQYSLGSNLYDFFDFAFLTNDNNYRLVGIRGIVNYQNKSMDNCINKLNEIMNEISSIFSSWERKDLYTEKFPSDPTGKSTRTSANFSSNQGYAAVSCWDFSSSVSYQDFLAVGIKTKKYNEWLDKYAY